MVRITGKLPNTYYKALLNNLQGVFFISTLYKKSKPLGKSDDSGFEFAKEMLQNDPTAAINFDRIQKHPTIGYIIFEYLLCEEDQKVNPYTSHPNRYWHKNSKKFISLWELTKALDATLYLVNYAKKGTKG